MSVKVTGLNALTQKLNAVVVDMNLAIDEAVKTTAFAVRKTAIKDIRTQSIGDTVTRYTDSDSPTPYQHIQSKSGDAPNNDTGALMRSIDVKHEAGRKEAFVFTNLKYGFFLETVHNRPFLEPAKDTQMPRMQKRLINAAKKQIEKAVK